MLRALARRQQEQTQSSLGKVSASQYEQGVFAAGQVNWPSGVGQYGIPGAEAAYDYMDTNTGSASARPQSSPYNLPVSEITLARQMMQSSANRGYEQPIRGGMPYGQQPVTPNMPSPNSQQMQGTNSAKILNYQQQMSQQRSSDMQFPFY